GDLEGKQTRGGARIRRAAAEREQPQREEWGDFGAADLRDGSVPSDRRRKRAGYDGISRLDHLIFAERKRAFRFQIKAQSPFRVDPHAMLAGFGSERFREQAVAM